MTHPAHPPEVAGRCTSDELIWMHVAGDRGPGSDHRVLAERRTTHDGRIGPNGRTVEHDGGGDPPFGVERARYPIIGERGRRTDEHVVADGDAVVDADVVLQFTSASDDHVIIDVDVLADNTACTNDRQGPHMRVMPHAGSIADRCLVFDDGRRVDTDVALAHARRT